MNNQPNSDYDSAWKEAITVYLEPFIEYCFPEVYQDINWEKGYETLDTELQELIRDSETGRRLADKLLKVTLRNGENALVLIHIEIQGQEQADFAERMYIYNHRLFDRYCLKVFSFAVLGDDNPNWRPTSYSYSAWGFESHLHFPSIKLLDYSNDVLEQSNNPFAIIIIAHLQTQATQGNAQQRFQFKSNLVRRLYQLGYTGEQIRQLFRFIEWIMTLPETLQFQFKTELNRYEEENRMPFLTSFEIDGMLKMGHENVIQILETRFGNLSDNLKNQINSLKDLDFLKSLVKQAVTVASLENFEELLQQQNRVEN
ncbi:transposase [Cronbergia sp. UHCC 0137]|uniref:transposase n=1 Tax=Cronbergia sp. UHCC 0137 TaxID=3110239 RepID=UPI002B2126DC|nr:transposase [Cronbergia sp. UHCC 0137]MEA5619015.1 transposase [Cronbergia sp. UHCC 0137]